MFLRVLELQMEQSWRILVVFDAKLITANVAECSWKNVLIIWNHVFLHMSKTILFKTAHFFLCFLTSDCVGLPVFSFFGIRITNSPTKPVSPVFFTRGSFFVIFAKAPCVASAKSGLLGENHGWLSRQTHSAPEETGGVSTLVAGCMV